jgi:amidase
MARTVEDTAILLAAMSGVDVRDPATALSEGKALADFTPYLARDGLKGTRIGVARTYFGFDPRVDRVMEACLQLMKEEGAELIDPIKLIKEKELEKSELEVLLYEFKVDLNRYLATLGPEAPVKSMEEVIQFNQRHSEQVMPYFGQDRMIKSQAKGPLAQKKYQNALARNLRLSRQEGIDAILIKHNLQAILAPTGGPAWMVDMVTGDHYSGGGFSSLAAVAGYPHITVPAGYVFGLPVGISFFASAWQEATLIRIAYAFEQASRIRKPPEYLPTVDLSLKGNSHA